MFDQAFHRAAVSDLKSVALYSHKQNWSFILEWEGNTNESEFILAVNTKFSFSYQAVAFSATNLLCCKLWTV
jgi:hypothetical protein